MNENAKLVLKVLERKRAEKLANPEATDGVSVRRWGLRLNEDGTENDHGKHLNPNQLRYALEQLVEAGLARKQDAHGMQSVRYFLDTAEDKARRAERAAKYAADKALMPAVLAELARRNVTVKDEYYDEVRINVADLAKLLGLQ